MKRAIVKIAFILLVARSFAATINSNDNYKVVCGVGSNTVIFSTNKVYVTETIVVTGGEYFFSQSTGQNGGVATNTSGIFPSGSSWSYNTAEPAPIYIGIQPVSVTVTANVTRARQ